MPVVDNALTVGADETDATSYTTASVTPEPNHLVLLAVAASESSNPPTPTISGNGLTWVQVGNDLDYDSGGGAHHSMFLFRAMGSSPSAGAITIDFGATTLRACSWQVTEFGNVDTSGTNGSAAIVQQDTNTASAASLTVTLGAFAAATNATYGFFACEANAVHTEGSGFAILGQTDYDNGHMSTEFRDDNDTTVDASWTGTPPAGGFGVEIKFATNQPAKPVKPGQWKPTASTVRPEWRWFWEPESAFFPMWEGASPRINGGAVNGIWTGSTEPSWVNTPSGLGVDFTGADNDYFNVTDSPTTSQDTQNLTVFALFRADSTPPTLTRNIAYLSDLNTEGWRLLMTTATTIRWRIPERSPANLGVSTAGLWSVGDVVLVVATVIDDGHDLTIINTTTGESATGGVSGSGTVTAPGDDLVIGNENSPTGGDGFDDTLLYFGVWPTTTMSDSQMEALARDPFGPIRPNVYPTYPFPVDGPIWGPRQPAKPKKPGQWRPTRSTVAPAGQPFWDRLIFNAPLWSLTDTESVQGVTSNSQVQAELKVTPSGFGVGDNDSGIDWDFRWDADHYQVTDAYTADVVFVLDSYDPADTDEGSSQRMIFSMGNWPNVPFQIFMHASNDDVIGELADGASVELTIDSGVVPALGVVTHATLVVQTGITNGSEMWINGATVGTGTVSAFGLDKTTIGLGVRGDDAETSIDGTVLTARLWDRALGAAEIARLHADPFGPIRPALWPQYPGGVGVVAAIERFINKALQSRKNLRTDADRLVSQDLMSNRKST